MLYILNGKLISQKEAVVPITDKAYFFDFAVYSSLKIIKSKIFFPDYHIDRLFESAKAINLEHNFTKEMVSSWLNLLIKKNKLKEAFLKIVLIGDPEKNKNARLYIFPLTGVTYYPKNFYSKGVKVVTYRGERRFPKAKTKDLLLSFLALREAKKNNAVEALMIDNEGNIREGTKSNFFAIKNDTIITPPKEKSLEGITKKMILKACKNDFKTKEEDIALSKVKNYDELFVSSTLFNVLPINQIDDIKLKTDFSQTKKIQKLFKDYYHKEVLK
jgi:branched-subunit amino acid aminotransferase/4-amino-4-deoxychorismate lyase